MSRYNKVNVMTTDTAQDITGQKTIQQIGQTNNLLLNAKKTDTAATAAVGIIATIDGVWKSGLFQYSEAASWPGTIIYNCPTESGLYINNNDGELYLLRANRSVSNGKLGLVLTTNNISDYINSSALKTSNLSVDKDENLNIEENKIGGGTLMKGGSPYEILGIKQHRPALLKDFRNKSKNIRRYKNFWDLWSRCKRQYYRNPRRSNNKWSDFSSSTLIWKRSFLDILSLGRNCLQSWVESDICKSICRKWQMGNLETSLAYNLNLL